MTTGAEKKGSLNAKGCSKGDENANAHLKAYENKAGYTATLVACEWAGAAKKS